mgnify:CR=1 FL=1
MRPWLLRRLAQTAATLLLALVLLFLLVRLAPGDPVATMLGEDRAAAPEEVARLRAQLGLDRPLPAQFAGYVAGLARGDLGTSIRYQRPVRELLASRLGPTLLLGGTVLLVNFTVGTWLGVVQATRRGRAADRWLSAAAVTSYAMPSFWLGLALAWLVGLRWRLLPVGGFTDPLGEGGAADVARHLVLPALTLSLASIGAVMRQQRSAAIEALGAPFIVTARAKGLGERAVTWRHAWRSALGPMLTLLGLWLPLVVTGAVFVEAVFAWPGIGQLAAQAAAARDYPLVLGASLLAAAAVLVGSLVADVGQALLDPRVRA